MPTAMIKKSTYLTSQSTELNISIALANAASA